jgi:hypothetical protein
VRPTNVRTTVSMNMQKAIIVRNTYSACMGEPAFTSDITSASIDHAVKSSKAVVQCVVVVEIRPSSTQTVW